MSELHLVLKHVWFEKIKSGEKTSEYREIKDFWNKKFEPVVRGDKNMWKIVVFHDGYTNKTIKCPLISVSRINTSNDLNLPCVWELKLGPVIN